MSYCINPNCGDRLNSDELQHCHSCGSSLTIKDQYRLIKPLRKLNGQHQTEIFEVDDGSKLKILKVLTNNRRRSVELFEQEYQVLKQLFELPVPKVYAYFTFVPPNSRRKLRCLVMEKVEGENLKQWLETNGKLTEAIAIDWLGQLLTILSQVHQQFILHRDLKPSNIMIRPDGKLVLIDFGTARKLSSTYVEKLHAADVTKVYSPGYTAPEQLQGEAVIQSDLFALGRTFVHLMTGIYPDYLPKTKINQLLWHQAAPQISYSLRSLIDSLIIQSPSARPSAPDILHRLNRISHRSNITKIWLGYWLKTWQRHTLIILISSMVIACLIIGVRYMGWLQPLELQAYDHLMQLRPVETPDSRLLLITVDEADIQYQNQQNMSLRWSLADQALAKLLVKLEQYQSRTIGIDIYRDFAADPDYPELARQLRNSDRLYAVCKVPAPEDGTPKATPPPPEIPDARIGFSDFVADGGDVVRRQLLHLTPPNTASCQAEYAFSLQLALDYLQRLEIESRINETGYLQIGTTIFKPINQHSGGYQTIDAAGYQIMLNYRASDSPKDIAPQVSLRDILSDHDESQLAELIQDRLIIIGITASSSTDDWQTPYSQQSSSKQKQIPGVFVQAQMASQIISAVIDARPLIWWWSNFWESIWIGVWSLLGGILGWYLRHLFWLGSAIAFGLFLLFMICWLTFLNSGWIPLIPSAFAVVLSSTVTVFFSRQPNKVK